MYLEIGRARYVEVGDEAVYVSEDTVPLLSDAVQADDGDNLLWILLLGRLASGWVNLYGLARGHVQVDPLLIMSKVRSKVRKVRNGEIKDKGLI